jgi:hypothetical protein
MVRQAHHDESSYIPEPYGDLPVLSLSKDAPLAGRAPGQWLFPDFGPDTDQGVIGGLDGQGLLNVGGQPGIGDAAAIPHYAFTTWQSMFAGITPAFIVGTYAERINAIAFLAAVWLKDLGA